MFNKFAWELTGMEYDVPTFLI